MSANCRQEALEVGGLEEYRHNLERVASYMPESRVTRYRNDLTATSLRLFSCVRVRIPVQYKIPPHARSLVNTNMLESEEGRVLERGSTSSSCLPECCGCHTWVLLKFHSPRP
jgi:hypothetical protein